VALRRLPAQSIEILRVSRPARLGAGAFEQKIAQLQTTLILADQLAYVFAAGAIAASGDLLGR
jgi:hypothetical protein